MLVLAVLLVSLLLISSSQQDRGQENRIRFSGGMERPSLHLECTVPGFGRRTAEELALQRTLYSDLPYVAVHLFAPPARSVPDGGRPANGNHPGLAQQDLSLYQFLQLAPGIDPGTFNADGQRAALLIPFHMDRTMAYEPGRPGGYQADADRALTERLLSAVWPVYRNPVFPDRRPEDFSNARTRIYVETMTVAGDRGDERYVVIGHLSYRFPDALNDGSLAWLGGFSSALTEIVYLGETWEDPENRTNRRIEFLRENGYTACANAYADYAYPAGSDSAVQAMYDKLLESGYSEDDMDQRACEAADQVRVSEALLEGRLDRYASILYPPFLAYPEAWAAYIAHCEAEQADPPQWFYRLFMNRLGFNRLAVE